MDKSRAETIRELALAFRERSSELHLKGLKRDSAALHYFIGAAKICQLTGNGKMADAIAGNVFLIATRGYEHVQYIIDKAE